MATCKPFIYLGIYLILFISTSLWSRLSNSKDGIIGYWKEFYGFCWSPGAIFVFTSTRCSIYKQRLVLHFVKYLADSRHADLKELIPLGKLNVGRCLGYIQMN